MAILQVRMVDLMLTLPHDGCREQAA